MISRSPRIMLKDYSKIPLINTQNIEFLKKYKIDLALRNLSDKTVYAYESDLIQWLTWVLDNQQNKSAVDLEDDDITEFLYYCKKQGNNVARLRRRISAISAFYRFLRKKRIMKANPTEFIEPPKRSTPVTVQTFLTTEQISLMREKLVEYGDIQLRLYATLSLSTLARLSAIASIRWEQIDLQECSIKNVLEKEGKVVDLTFSEEVKILLTKLKKERKDKKQNDHGWLFYTGRCTDTKHIATCTLQAWCRKIGAMIGVPTLHPHDFRHSAATLLKNAGMTLEDISVLLNHESTDTTKKFYIKQDMGRINAQKNRFNL